MRFALFYGALENMGLRALNCVCYSERVGAHCFKYNYWRGGRAIDPFHEGAAILNIVTYSMDENIVLQSPF